MKKFSISIPAIAALLLAGLIACAPPEKDSGGEQTESGVKASEATSAQDFAAQLDAAVNG